MGGRDWTESELQEVRQMYADAPPLRSKELAEKLGRTVDAVVIQGSRMGLGDSKRRKVVPKPPRFPDLAALREFQSKTMKAHLAEKGHPRGALGIKHSAETRAIISAKSKAAWRDPASKRNDPTLRAQWTEKSVAAIHAGPPRGGYSRAAGGKRSDLGDRYFRSAWEANYARYLNWRVARKEISAWEYETKTFVFERIKRGTRSYTPDFKLLFPDGRHEWHEVKGWMDPKSVTRLGRMTRYFPAEVVRVIDEKWFRQAKASGLTALISGWESKGRVARGC